jgi:hypothetical protein
VPHERIGSLQRGQVWLLRRRRRLYGSEQPVREKDDRLQLGSAGLQGRNERPRWRALQRFQVLLWRPLQRMQGRQFVFARQQPLSHRQSHLVRGRHDDVHRPEWLGVRRHLLLHHQRGERRVRRARDVRRMHAQRGLHSNGQAMPTGHDVVHDGAGMRGSQQYQRRSALRNERRVCERRVCYVQRDVVPQRMLRQHRMRDHRAKDERVREGRCSVCRLPGQPELHDRERMYLPVVGSRLLRGRVHQHEK